MGYKEKLLKIKGIGPATVQDIISVFPTEAELLEGVKRNFLPFRDDVAKKLKQIYGGRKKMPAESKSKAVTKVKTIVCSCCHTAQPANEKICPNCNTVLKPRK